jgi:hypothetical protein
MTGKETKTLFLLSPLNKTMPQPPSAFVEVVHEPLQELFRHIKTHSFPILNA